ncbi:MAG: gliding motility-associated C-terminal domain-containing protein, partial [Flavobacteriaceae bacterium]
AVDGGFDVDVSTADNTATTADSDYTAVTSATETFAGTASETETFTITIGGDTKVEADELVDIAMSNLVPSTVDASDIDITDAAQLTITNDDSATITIANVSGNEDDGAITVTVTLDNAVDGGLDLDVSTADGTATTADSDYTTVINQTLTFAGTAGETETFTVTPTADVNAESNETVLVSMSNLVLTTVDSGDIDITDGATVTITNDDNSLISVDDPIVSEGDSGTTTLTYTVTLDQSSPGTITVGYATSDGTATAGSDYTAASGTVTFNPGDTSKTVDIMISGEQMVEVDETITFTLSSPTGTAQISDGTATGTINNDDTTVVTIADVSANENSGAQTITATLSNPVQGGFAFDVFTTDGTATVADSDYSSTAGSTLTFAGTVGETQTLNLQGLGDTKVEADETFTIAMQNVGFTSVNTTNIDITDVATYTILNDDSATVTIANVAVNENDGTATVTLTLDNAVDGGFDVAVSTADNTATTADGDYTAVTSATETFAGTASETETFTITIGGDTKVEADEIIDVLMSNLVPTTVDASDIDITDDAEVTIINDDSASITISDVTVNEADGTATITATIDNQVDGGFSVDVSTADGTATTADSDYTAVSSETLTFTGTANEQQTFMVTIADDNKVETNEMLTISMSNLVLTSADASDLTITDTATLTITNDDTTVVTIADVSVNEDLGTVVAITATLSNPVQGGFYVNVSTADGTATLADGDYIALGGNTLVFAGTAGETQSLNSGSHADTKVEADETVTITMSNVGFTTVDVNDIDITDTATFTILNDDTAAVTIENVSGSEDGGAITVTATLDNAVDGGFTVDVGTTDNTATQADSDYTAVVSETLTFVGTAGETQTFTITPTADTKLEADETAFIGISNLQATTLTVAINDGANVTITNDDTAAVTIADVSANEDDGSITVTATLDNAVQGGFSVDVNTVDGTATTADSDYTAVVSEILTFAGTAGEMKTFTITPTVDTKVETDETLTISQSNLSGTTLAVDITDGAMATINNDDTAAVTIEDVMGNEDDGAQTFTVTLDNAVQGGFTVDVNTLDATATVVDGDYTAVTGQILTFAGTAGETQTFTVTPTTDNKVEADEIVTLGMTTIDNTPSFGDISITDTATYTIQNDDSTVITIEDVTVVEADGVANITATLTNPVQGGFDLHITTTDNTAVSATDYTAFTDALAATFTGTVGETQTLAIPITDDMVGEEIEDFTVTLSSVANTTLGASITTTDSALVTITDDDAPVVTMVSVPTDGTYGIGDNLDFTVTFTNPANITGAPSIPVTIGTTTVQATLNGTFTNSLTADFRYTIVEGDLDTDGIAVGAAINLNGGTILGNTNIPAILDLNNVASTANVNVDGIKPTVVITSTVADPTNAAFTVTFTFSEDVTDFVDTSILVVNGAAGTVSGTGSVYTAIITPTADGIVTVQAIADGAFDIVGNGNALSSEFSVLYDATNPTVVSMTTTAPDPTNMPFTLDIVFSEDVFNFVMADLVVTNGTPSSFVADPTDARLYSVLITPDVTDNVFVDIPAGVANDLATNPNDAGTFEILYDDTPPIPPTVTHISDYTCTGDVNMTGDNTLEISGTAEEGSIVEVFQDGTSIGTTMTTNAGFFTFDHTGTTLADGTYSFTVTATDNADNTSALSAPLTITINSVDTDGDGLPDFCDDDVDGNGTVDADEDCDGDGIIDSLDTDNSSCTSTISQTKQYGFSPNGDGVNDGWFIDGITAYPNSVVQVFNRSGKLVFKKKGYQNDWTGISNQIANNGTGTRLPVGPYLFIIDLADGSQPTRGWIYINY